MKPLSASLLLLTALAADRASAQEAPAGAAPPVLVPGREYTDSLATHQARAYTLDLRARHFVAGVVEQQSVDVVVTVRSPDGRLVGSFDGPARGAEPFQFTSEAAGRYRIEVAPFEEEHGRFLLRIARVEPGATTPAGKVDQRMAAFQGNATPGAAILVVQGDRVLLSRGYGMAHLEQGTPITPATVFDGASLAKQFTGIAIAMLHEKGALSLDDDVRKHLPYLPDFGRTVTVRHLVHHTGGLRDWIGVLGLAGVRPDDVITGNDVVEMVRRQRELDFEPGSEILYSNTGYFLLAKVVEAVTGQSFADWTRDNLFAPLGMKRTHFATDHRTVVPGRAQSYNVFPNGQFRNATDNLAVVGSSSVFTTTEDLGRWLVNFGRKSVGGPRVHALMQQRGALSNGDSTEYAFGIEVDRHRGLKRLSHSGGWAGFNTFLAYYPEIDAGVVVLSNLATFPSWQITNEVTELFFGGSLAPVAAPQPAPPRSAATRPAPWVPSAAELAAYAGRYYSPELQTEYTVAVRDGKLVAVHARNGEITMTAKERDAFDANRPYFSRAGFQRDGTGSVVGMRVSGGRNRSILFVRVAEVRG